MPGVVCDLGVAARATKDNRILLVQEAGGSYKGKWSLPRAVLMQANRQNLLF